MLEGAKILFIALQSMWEKSRSGGTDKKLCQSSSYSSKRSPRSDFKVKHDRRLENLRTNAEGYRQHQEYLNKWR